MSDYITLYTFPERGGRFDRPTTTGPVKCGLKKITIPTSSIGWISGPYLVPYSPDDPDIRFNVGYGTDSILDISAPLKHKSWLIEQQEWLLNQLDNITAPHPYEGKSNE